MLYFHIRLHHKHIYRSIHNEYKHTQTSIMHSLTHIHTYIHTYMQGTEMLKAMKEHGKA
jgi:hypothetical protein